MEGRFVGYTKSNETIYMRLPAGYRTPGRSLDFGNVSTDSNNPRVSGPKPPKRQCQTRDHLLKNCPEWRTKQKALWEKVKKETGRWKSRWKIRDLFADPRCSQAILDYLASTQVGRRVPTLEEDEEDAQSEASEWESLWYINFIPLADRF